MLVELVRVHTSDGHRLDGSLLKRSGEGVVSPPVDAFIFLHGVGGNFYAGNLFDYLAGELSQRGMDVLRVNTRGHDSISITWGRTGPVRHGAAYEVVDQCRYDLTAWIQCLLDRGCQQIGILGHSLGAIKAIYSQAHEPHPAVRCLIACSAPRLSYSAFMNSEAQPKFFESMASARELIEKGQPESLFQAKFPFPILITAAGYVDKYGPDERYNVLRLVDRISCRMLATYGQLELENGGIAFAGMVDELTRRRREGQSLDVATVAGADHAYNGVYDRLGAKLFEWLGTEG